MAYALPVLLARSCEGARQHGYLAHLKLTGCSLQVIWLLYPETKGRALEDMDSLFGKADPRHSAVMLNGDIDDSADADWRVDDEHEDGILPAGRSSGEEDAPLLR